MEFGSSSHCAGNWTSRIDLGFHILRTGNRSILSYSPYWKFLNYKALWFHVAALASLQVRTGKVFRIFWFVGLAGFLRNSLGNVSIVIQTQRTSSSARSSKVTIDEVLSRKQHIRPHSVPLYVNSVWKRTRSSHGPTTSTVIWNVLISVNRQIIDAIHISPVPIIWQVLSSNVFLRERTNNVFDV